MMSSSQIAVVAQTFDLPTSVEEAEAMASSVPAKKASRNAAAAAAAASTTTTGTALPDAKRARVEQPKSYKEIDLATATLKVIEGKDEKYFVPLLDGEATRVILNVAGPTKITFGFDMKGTYDQRSFNSEGVRAKGSESLGVRVELDKEQVQFLEAAEAKFKELMPPEKASCEWVPLVTADKRTGESTAKVTVCLTGEESSQTLLKFMHEGQVLSGKGWDFLKERADADRPGSQYAFGGAEAKTVVRFRAYSMLGKDGKVRRGITLAATQLFIKPRERVVIEEVDVLEAW